VLLVTVTVYVTHCPGVYVACPSLMLTVWACTPPTKKPQHASNKNIHAFVQRREGFVMPITDGLLTNTVCYLSFRIHFPAGQCNNRYPQAFRPSLLSEATPVASHIRVIPA
jgi:hypothetical protein